MEPTFAASTSETVTAGLRAQLDAAIAAIPYRHATNSSRDEVFQSKEAAFARLQDGAFIKGFALVKESSKSKQGQVVRLYLECVHHKKATKNSRKLSEVDRRRHQTKILAGGCTFSLVVQYDERQGWTVRPKDLCHNHAPNPDPFQYHQHQYKQPGYAAAITLASIHRGMLSYRHSAAILEQEGFEVKKRNFWNLRRKRDRGHLYTARGA
jgi:hypothetical protein